MPLSVSRSSGSEAETRLIGLALGKLLRGGDVVLLEGTLGAGKTTLVRAVAEGLGLDTAAVASPTFVIVHSYPRPGSDTPSPEHPDLVHVDAYRLGGGADALDSVGWDAVMCRVQGPAPTACLMVEWPERLGADFGLDAAAVRIEHAGDESRELFLTLPDSWKGRPGMSDLLARRPTTCPVTGERVEADSPTYPFASERARLADLHRWFSGKYQFSRDVTEADLEEG